MIVPTLSIIAIVLSWYYTQGRIDDGTETLLSMSLSLAGVLCGLTGLIVSMEFMP